MTSLADAYEGHVGEVVSPRRLYLGVGLFASGAVLTALGVLVATTDLFAAFGLDRMAAWRRAGVLAGIGVPAVLAGVFTVLPSSRRIKAAATIGASISVLGVALFWYAYPAHWAGYGRELTLPVTAVYFFGTTTSVWCMFVGVANFKRRNDPGGTVSLKVTKGGQTKVMEVSRSDLEEEVKDVGGSSASTAAANTVAAAEPDQPGARTGGDTPTGTAQGVVAEKASAASSVGPASDGGRNDNEITSLTTDAEVVSSTESARQLADRYCGNCEHFRYVRSEDGMRPYCGFHGETMDDMEACDEWEPNH